MLTGTFSRQGTAAQQAMCVARCVIGKQKPLSLQLDAPATLCPGGMNSWCIKLPTAKNPGNFFTAPRKYLLRNNLIFLKATGRMLMKIIIIMMVMMMMTTMTIIKEFSYSQHNIFLRGTKNERFKLKSTLNFRI
jgi:hypothetical protein